MFSNDFEIFRFVLTNKENVRMYKQEYHEDSDHLALVWIFKQWESHLRQGAEHSLNFCNVTSLDKNKMFSVFSE